MAKSAYNYFLVENLNNLLELLFFRTYCNKNE